MIKYAFYIYYLYGCNLQCGHISGGGANMWFDDKIYPHFLHWSDLNERKSVWLNYSKSLYVEFWSTVNTKRPLNLHACTKFPPSLLYISLQFASTKHNILFLTGESLFVLKSKNDENFVPFGLFGDCFGPYKVNWPTGHNWLICYIFRNLKTCMCYISLKLPEISGGIYSHFNDLDDSWWLLCSHVLARKLKFSHNYTLNYMLIYYSRLLMFQATGL